MCSIIGFFNKENAFESLTYGLNLMKNRGPDGSGYYDGTDAKYNLNDISKSKNIIGHNLLSIVNKVNQPIIKKKSALITNSEIYNWKELKKEFKINAKNDSELLFLLIEKIGIFEALKKLDGVYSLCYWKDNKVYLTRDIIGEKPLFIHYKNHLEFSSEKKGIINSFEAEPTIIYEYDIKENKLIKIKKEFNFTQNRIKSEKEAIQKLKVKLYEAIKKRIPNKPFGILFSGGIDSVIIAKITKELYNDVNLYTACTSENSEDLKYAKIASEKLNLKLSYIIPNKKEIEEEIKNLYNLIEESDNIKIGVGLVISFASKLAKRNNCKVLFSGNGADELFLGYNRHRQNIDDKTDLNEIENIHKTNTYRDDIITMNNSIEIRNPYLDLNFIDIALQVSPELKIKNDINKYILRKLAIELDIPEELAYRKKKAAQYGSGFDKELRRFQKRIKNI